MRCLNKIHISGNVVDLIHFGATPTGTAACTFYILSDRPQFGPPTKVKVNVYGGKLVEVCQRRLKIDTHILIEGELMNRDVDDLVTVEVRVHEIFFYDFLSRASA